MQKVEQRKSLQKDEILDEILRKYSRKAPIHRMGLELLYDRAEKRGYRPIEIYKGLQICICKNYVREQYVPPFGDPLLEVLHERKYMGDWEFRDIFKGGNWVG